MIKKAGFAGGCFWCMVKPFTAYEGIMSVVAGYEGGSEENAKYELVSTGTTGHYESIEITYDDELISYDNLLDIFWRQIDPTDAGGQFADRGSQYRTAIFYYDEDQKKSAEDSKEKLEKSGGFDYKIETEIIEHRKFYEAEEYHQMYHIKRKSHYENYYRRSGRHDFLKSIWDGPRFSPDTINSLSDIQYEVTQNGLTEVPYENEYFDFYEDGIYVDVVSGEPLFDSKDKVKSVNGWPLFKKPIHDTSIIERIDFSMGLNRIEVRSISGNSHLGHKIDVDGKKLYEINSAALRFIPRKEYTTRNEGSRI